MKKKKKINTQNVSVHNVHQKGTPLSAITFLNFCKDGENGRGKKVCFLCFPHNKS